MEGNPNIITGILDFSDIKTCNYWRQIFAEFLGTFMLCFFGCSAGNGQTGGVFGTPGADGVVIAFTSGLTLALCIYIFEDVSGAHINPCVTISMFVGRRLKLSRAIGYLLAQVIGGILGSGMVYVIANHDFEDKSSISNVGQIRIGMSVTRNTTSPDGVAQLRGMLSEMMGTFLMIMVVLALTDQARPGIANWGGVPLTIGLSVTTSQLALSNFSGSSINPARAFGAFVIGRGGYSPHWIYWVGPIIGGSLAVIVYDVVLCPYNCKTKRDVPAESQIFSNAVVVFPNAETKPV